MKMKHILLFCISVWCISFSGIAQEESVSVNDTVAKTTKYGLRIGADLSKPLRTILEDGYEGFEIIGDFRLSKKFYAAAEIGNEKRLYNESNLTANTSGSYIKIGVDYNAYNNWLGMTNSIYGGLRYGFATFKQELLSYGVYTTDGILPTSIRTEPKEFTGLTGHWVELIVGVKTEVLKNLYLSINVQLKRKIAEDEPENFGNLYIPGFNRTYDYSEFGAGYGYSISYLIPLFNK